MAEPKWRTFQAWLREVRNTRGMTQEDLAARSGLTQAYISALEKGIRAPRRPAVISLAKSLVWPEDEPLALAGFRSDESSTSLSELERIPADDDTRRIVIAATGLPAVRRKALADFLEAEAGVTPVAGTRKAVEVEGDGGEDASNPYPDEE